jgi:hypothetical protein
MSAVLVAFDNMKTKRGRCRSGRQISTKNSPSQQRRRLLHNKRRRQKYRLHHKRRSGLRRKVRKLLSFDSSISFPQEDFMEPADSTSHINSHMYFEVSILLIFLCWMLFASSHHSSSSHFLSSLPSSLIVPQESCAFLRGQLFLRFRQVSLYPYYIIN